MKRIFIIIFFILGLIPNLIAQENSKNLDSLEIRNYSVNNDLRPYWNYHSPKDPFKAGLLSFFIPSGGHFYNDQIGKGFFYGLGVPILYVSGVTFSNSEAQDDQAQGAIMMGISLLLYLWSGYDAIISSNRINEKYFEEYKKINGNYSSDNNIRGNKKRSIKDW